MSVRSARRRRAAQVRARSWAVTGAIALALGLSACTAVPGASEQFSEQITTTWTAPADATAEGPTAAPEVPKESSDLDSEVALSTGMTVSIASMTTMAVTAETPGEVDGSAVVVTVALHNTSDSPQSIDSAVVMLEAADGQVGIATTAGPNQPFAGTIDPGDTATGVYVFMLDDPQGRDVTVSVNYSAGEPIALFAGPIH